MATKRRVKRLAPAGLLGGVFSAISKGLSGGVTALIGMTLTAIAVAMVVRAA